ncbi:DMT family transporter [Abyssicoccus albus]|uniref:DMT family transporter n=1 Tax=Abyssicoccus albus TaxID=1817405 RepID=UPI00097E2C0F|nr:SMR family transporter [Abyssicoccus albus]AQL55528.1 QacE family quaternary ammonium compound efflux SMR transporter [Abyssicoccus albus]
MGWIYVMLAACFEVLGVIGLSLYSSKHTIRHFILFVGGFFMSFLFLYFSFQYLQLSIAYAVWVGLGTFFGVLASIVLFNESKHPLRLISLLLIILGVVGLKYFG